jgi:hypothetical protein
MVQIIKIGDMGVGQAERKSIIQGIVQPPDAAESIQIIGYRFAAEYFCRSGKVGSEILTIS